LASLPVFSCSAHFEQAFALFFFLKGVLALIKYKSLNYNLETLALVCKPGQN
jgi:hypothetical protein